MTSGQGAQAQRYIRSIQRNLRLLEELFKDMEARTVELRPADARSELLERVHVAGAVEQRQLFELLDQRSIGHTWIGAQVSAEYLDLWQAADGRSWYRVTQRAIRELRLGQLTSPSAVSSDTKADAGPPSPENRDPSVLPAFSVFNDDWSSEEDSVYDGL